MRIVTWAVLSAGVAGCYTTTIEPASGADRQRLLADFGLAALDRRDPVSRSEIEERLGVPSAWYEDTRVVTYSLRKVRGHFELPRAEGPPSTIGLDYRLVLVFAPDDTVERWSLVDRSR